MRKKIENFAAADSLFIPFRKMPLREFMKGCQKN